MRQFLLVHHHESLAYYYSTITLYYNMTRELEIQACATYAFKKKRLFLVV
jgi:hypothetical protein